MDDVYIVLYGGRVLGVSGRLQGAELIRADAARQLAVGMDGNVTDEDYTGVYNRIRIETHSVQDVD